MIRDWCLHAVSFCSLIKNKNKEKGEGTEEEKQHTWITHTHHPIKLLAKLLDAIPQS
jgi:hypothetical protein